MISEDRATLSIGHEIAYWRRQPLTEFVSGVLKGLEIARDCFLKERAVRRHEPPEGHMTPWSAEAFRKSIHTALVYLGRGDRRKCIRKLEQAIEHKAPA